MSNQLSNKLSELVDSGTIASFIFEELDENGEIGHSQSRNTERLTLVFLNGQKLVLGTFCSGCLEDTFFTL